jgi:hydrogenase expression/formation protein HypE
MIQETRFRQPGGSYARTAKVKQLHLGKLPIEVLSKTTLAMTGSVSPLLVAGPKPGLDFAAVKIGARYLIVSADPITGVSENIGRYAVKVSANDVATSGNRPQFAESIVLLPERSSAAYVGRIARQIGGAAKESGITIVGGHTEVTPGLRNPIVAMTVFSMVDRFISSSGARDGDTMMMSKTAGLEGTAEIATDSRLLSGKLTPSMARHAANLISQVSITEEAVAGFQTGHVRAMHDCTEGGVLGAAYEMSLASGLGFVLDEVAVPVAPVTRAICSLLSIDPLKLIGSGSLLLAVEPGGEAEVEGALKPICRMSRVGRFQKGRRVMLARNGLELPIREAPEDELWRVLSRSGGRRQRL